MSSTGPFANQNPEIKFKKGFKDGRYRQPTVYWQPATQDWHDRGTWTIKGTPVPRIPIFGPEFDNIDYLFGEVKKTAEHLAPIYGEALHWSPRDGAWVTATTAATEPGKASTSLPPCVDDMKLELEGLNDLYKTRVIQEPEWRAQRLRVIENCLGKTKLEAPT